MTTRLTRDSDNDRGRAPESGGVTAPEQADAGLDQLLTEHVDLAADVVRTAVTTGASSGATESALAALDQNTQGLGTVFGRAYGPAVRRQFLKLWRAHAGFFVDYALGVSTHDPAKVATANQDLAGYVTQFSAFVSGATKLPRSAVAADARGHVATLKAAIHAIVSGRPDAVVQIEVAARHMNGTAAVLARGSHPSSPAR